MAQSLTTRIAIVVLAVLAAVLGWRLYHTAAEKKKAEFDLGLASARILNAKFAATGDLRAARLTGEALSAGACTSAYLFDSRQRTVAPFRVDYMVDLARIDRSDFRWDENDRIMFVELPGLRVEAPAVDMDKARSQQSGIFISRACGLAMGQQVAGRLKQAAAVRANQADHLAAAAASARARVDQLVRSTLAAAGLTDVNVRVRLATDPRPTDDRQWDRSRSIDEVLSDPKFAP